MSLLHPVFLLPLWLIWLLAGSAAVHAATRTWTGGAGPQTEFRKWSLAANWSPTGVPQSGDLLAFSKDTFCENDLTGLTLGGVRCEARTEISGQPLTLAGVVELSGNDPLVFFNDVTFGGTAGVVQEFRARSGRCDFKGAVRLNGHDVLVTGGDNAASPQSRVLFEGPVTGDGTLRVRSDAGFENLAGLSLVGDQTGFTGRLWIEHGRGVMIDSPTSWPGTVVVGSGDGKAAEFRFEENVLAASSVLELHPGAEATANFEPQVGELRLHGGTLGSGQLLRVLGSVNQLADSAPVTLIGDFELAEPGLTVAVAGLTVQGTLQLATDPAVTEFVKRGPGKLTLAGPSGMKPVVRVAEGTLSITHRDGLGSTANGTVVAPGATIELDFAVPPELDQPLFAVAEPLTFEGHASVPQCFVTGAANFTGLVTLAADTLFSSTGELRFSGPVGGPGRLRGQTSGDGLLVMTRAGSQVDKTYAGGTELVAGRLEIRSYRAVADGVLVIGTGVAAATVTVTGEGRLDEVMQVDVRSGGKLVLAGETDTLGSLRLAGNARVEVPVGDLSVGGSSITMAPVPAGTAVIQGTFRLTGGRPTLDVQGRDSTLQLNGMLLHDDPGAPLTLTKRGPGSLIFSGALPNSIDGDTVVEEGTLILNKSAGVAVRRGLLQVAPKPKQFARLSFQGVNQLHADVAVELGAGGTLELAGSRAKPEPVGSLAGAGEIVLGSGSLQVGGSGRTTECSGPVRGAGGLIKTGAGTLRFTGTAEHTGGTTVSGGALLVDGRILAGNVAVNGNSILGGRGTVPAVTVSRDSILAPGSSAGRLTTGDLVLLPGARLRMELDGNAAGNGFDQLTVNGTVALEGARLDLLPSFVPEVGKTFRLIDNNLADAITGAFQNLPPDSRLTNGPVVFAVSYAGGNSANDLELKVVGTDAGPANRPPNLSAVSGPRTVAEGESFNFQLAANDPDTGDTLTFSLDEPVPAGVQVTATGTFLWQPTEAQGPSTNVITVRVSDSAQPPASVTQSFTLIVTEENSVPQLEPVADFTLVEGAELNVKLAASDEDIPAQSLAFSLVGEKPAGATLNAATGRLRWTPTEAQGPSTNTFTVQVTDDGSPPQSGSVSFQVIVTERNRVPVPAAIADQEIPADTALALFLTATDPDLPAQTLMFSIEGSRPQGMSLDSATGRLTWEPTADQRPSTNTVTVKVTDSGVPAKSAILSFTVRALTVGETPMPALSIGLLPDGQLEFAWDSEPGVSYRLEQRDSLATGNWALVESLSATAARTTRRLPQEAEVRFFRLAVP